jgi:dienelactone hydrolase
MMKMSGLLALLALQALIASVVAQPIVAKPARPDLAALEGYLKAQAFQLLAERKQRVAAIKTPEQIAQRQKELKSFLLRSLGDWPERTPLNARVVGARQHDGYRVERVIFESRPRHHVTASLYLPDSPGRVPGVLVPCGHSAGGKAEAAYQQMCLLLAKNGMAVFCYDPIGQGERVQMLDAEGRPAIRQGSTTEHTLTGIGALLVGRQAASYRIWDGMRALDYLASRPEVDASRLGCTGNSGGGTLTAYLMSLDDRILAAAPSCFITSLERLFATIGPQDAEQNINGQVAAGLDHADYLTMRAPKPTLMSVGTRDFFDIQGSWDTFREVKLIYGRLGFGERVDLFESDEPHGFTSPRRIASARWLRRWLLKLDDPITEPDLPVCTATELQCTVTGQVLSDLRGVSVFDLNAERERELRPDRAAFCRSSSSSAFRERIGELLGIKGRQAAPGIIRVDEQAPCLSGQQRFLSIQTEPGVVLTAIELVPEWPDETMPALVKLSVDQARELEPGGPVEALMRRGRRVVLADLRGMGQAASRSSSGRTDSPLGHEVKEAFLSMHIGRPLLGQRVTDLLVLLEDLKSRKDSPYTSGFELVGVGPAGLAVLHAAALDEHGLIRGITLERSLFSWADVVQRGVSRNQIGSAVPGVLRYYDLPDLAARLEPCPLTIRSPVDAMDRPLSQSELQAAFAPCIESYGAGGPLTLQASP